jgi:transposase
VISVFGREKAMPKRTHQDPKLESLRQNGTLNPRPQAVTDELFASHDFFDARDVVQVKYEMLRHVERDGQSITEAAAKGGFSRPSFYQARSAFELSGLDGLAPHKRGPKKAHKLTQKILEFIRKVQQDDPSLVAVDLANRIEKRFGVSIHPRTIERRLARNQKKRQKPA